MFKALIMDLDGTCVDTLASIAYSVNRVLDKLSLSALPEEGFKYYAGDGARTMFERCLPDAGDQTASLLEKALDIYPGEFLNGCVHNVTSFSGLTEVLEELKLQGIRLAVVTNKAQINAEKVIRTVYGGDLIERVLGESPDYPKKPDPKGTLSVAKGLGVKPDECIYLGDTNTDMRTGQAAGMFTVGVTWGFRPREELEEFKPDSIISDPHELLSLFA